MFVLVTFLPTLLPQTTAPQVFDASSRAHLRLVPIRVQAEITGGSAGKSSRMRYTVTRDAKSAVVRMEEPASGGRGAADRSFWFRPDSVLAGDRFARERLQREIPSSRSVGERAVYVLGQTDDLLRVLLDGPQMGEFLKPFRDLQDWKVRTGSGSVVLVRDVKVPGGRNQSVFRFEAKTYRLTSVSLSSPEAWQKWTIRYLNPAKPNLSIPTSWRTVDAFTVAAAPPKFADGTSRRVIQTMLDAYAALDQVTLLVKDGKSETLILHDAPKLRERSSAMEFSYDGKTLSLVRHRTKEFLQGEISPAGVVMVLAQLGEAVEPFSRDVLQGQVPNKSLLGSEFKVTSSGSFRAPSGVNCDVISAVSARNQMTLMVRQDLKLLDALTATVLDTNGRILGSSAKRYRYLGVGRSTPAEQFVLKVPTGYQVGKLPAIKKVKGLP